MLYAVLCSTFVVFGYLPWDKGELANCGASRGKLKGSPSSLIRLIAAETFTPAVDRHCWLLLDKCPQNSSSGVPENNETSWVSHCKVVLWQRCVFTAKSALAALSGSQQQKVTLWSSVTGEQVTKHFQDLSWFLVNVFSVCFPMPSSNFQTHEI